MRKDLCTGAVLQPVAVYGIIVVMRLDGLDLLINVNVNDADPGKASITVRVNRHDDGGLSLGDIPTSHQDGIGFGDQCTFTMAYSPVVAASLRDKISMAMDSGATVGFRTAHDRDMIIDACHRLPEPIADWDQKSDRAVLRIPRTYENTTMMRKLNATPRADGSWSIPVTTLRDFLTWNESLPEWNRIRVSDGLSMVSSESLPAPYDGTAESLRNVPISVLRTIQANNQSYAMRSKNRASLLEKFRSIGIENCHDLLMLRPYRYIDRSEPQDVRDLIEGETATIVGRITEWKKPSPKLDVMVLEDGRGVTISCSFFNSRWMPEKYRVGDEVIAVGKYTPWRPANGGGRSYPQLQQPLVDSVDKAGVLPIMPEYHTPSKAALSSTVIMHCEQELIGRLGDGFKGPVWADEALKANGVSSNISYGDALRTMHLPTSRTDMDEATKALAFCELVQLLVCIESTRTGDGTVTGVDNHMTGVLTGAYVNAFPYPLTGAQERAVKEIREGLESPRQMRALLVGDVGAGKTTVMHLAALMSVESGHQAVVCAPTEILAQQLYTEFMKLYEQFPGDVKSSVTPILHAAYKGKGARKRERDNRDAVADGSANLIFGTHAVLNLDYHDLGFVGVDEQHKFGAEQRNRLLEVRDDGRQPDMLMQTATPIPRSMAQVYYGDVSYLRLDEMPAGRQPIVTKWVKTKGDSVVKDADSPVWSDAMGEIGKGHGVFVVCPMVSDSEKIDAASVKRTAEVLGSTVFRDVRMATVYGGQDSKKQDEAILGFKNGDIDVLVASSVVEVGVSCPKATRMVVLDANRFGLASLHQIRGRIGRSSLPSKCWLVAMTFNETATRRMQAMCDTLDGWTLSKTDLRNRGTGSLFGTRQSGRSDLVFADLVTDAKWIDPARSTAIELLNGSESSSALADAKRWFGVEDDGQLTMA